MKTISATWDRFCAWANKHAKLSIGLVIGMALLGGGGVAAAVLYPSPQAIVQTVVEQAKPKPTRAKKHYSPLTGVEVPNEATTKQQVKAIMIENSPSSRPQSGLQETGIVYEAIAEGGITRLLTLHQESTPGLIGPVRSLRPYYVDWLAPYDATVSHVGGSANALKEIRNGSYKDVDQFFNGQYYWRATDRAAPHNVYTNTEKLNAMNNAKGYTSSTFKSWPRKTGKTAAAPNATKIDITVSSPLYNVHYDYNAAANNYTRVLGGQAHTDREKGQIAPKVVIAIKVPTSRGFEDGYREQMDTIGTGQAYVFQDGQVIEAKWHKPERKSAMRFYDGVGRTIPFNAGQTWITVIAPEKSVAWQ